MAASSHEGGASGSPHGSEGAEAHRHGESWLDRLRHRLGFGGAASLREDLEYALQSAKAGPEDDFTAEERLMLRNILRLRDLRVEDVMITRADIEAVAAEVNLSELLLEFEKAGHSRLPVFQETLDAPLGMVHIKDVVGYITRQAMISVGEESQLEFGRIDLSATLGDLDLVRQVLFVPAVMAAADLLVSMQATRIHMALVIDEHGGTDGLVTIEDLVEMVVGDIEDEHDEDEGPTIGQIADGSFVADARVPLDEVVELLGEEFDVSEAMQEVDSLGGLLVTLIGRVPVEGERIPGPGPWRFEVLEADPSRVRRIRIERIEDAAAPPSPAEESPDTSARRQREAASGP